MRLLSRIFGRRDPTSTGTVPAVAWQPLYYPEGLQYPQPAPEGRVYLTTWPDILPRDACLKYGLEAWLGMHAMRRQGCALCLQCTEPQQSLILEFYPGSSETRENHNDYIGAYWHRWHTTVPDTNRVMPWSDVVSGQPLDGYLAYADPVPLMKSLHYPYEDGKIMSRWGNIVPASPGESYYDQGVIHDPGGLATHSSLRLAQISSTGIPAERPPAVLVEWDPDEIRWALAVEFTSDVPNSTLWAYSPPIRLPNRWLQEHPEPNHYQT